MSSSHVIPFDHKPVSIQVGSGTYTCPTGKYARVTINLSGYAQSLFTCTGSGISTLDLQNGMVNHSFDVWVNAADTIAATLSNASGTTNCPVTAITSAAGETTITVNRSGTTIGVFRAHTQANVYNSQNTNAGTITRSGSSSFNWVAEEFNVIT